MATMAVKMKWKHCEVFGCISNYNSQIF